MNARHLICLVATLCLGAATVAGGCRPKGEEAAPQEPETTAPEASPVAVPAAAGAGEAATKEIDGNVDRSTIDDVYKWDLTTLFSDTAAFDAALAGTKESRAKLAGFAGRLNEPRTLLACMKLYFDTRLMTKKLTTYASLDYETHQKSSEAQARHEKALAAMEALMAASGFIRREVLDLDDAAMEAAYEAAPGLKEYAPYIDNIRRRRAHVLGPEAERVLALMGDNLWAEIDLNELPAEPEKIYKALRKDLKMPEIKDEQGKSVQLGFSNFGRYRGSNDREVRKSAVEGLFGALAAYKDAFAATLAAQVRFTVSLARARGYDTALDAYLIKDDIDPAVYRSLISAIRANVAPLHRYISMRKRMLGVDQLRVYDLYATLIPAVEMSFSYDEARQIIPEALAPLGEAYVDVIKKGLAPGRGWIDVYPHEGKTSGAFVSTVYGVHPYVMLNYYGKQDDLTTLAHELGHALHSDLAMKAQPLVTADYAPFLAEIASTLNEKFLSDYLMKRAKSDDEKLFLLGELVETIRQTIYRQALFAEFELAIHTAAEAGTPLTAEYFDAKYAELLRAYYGPDLTIAGDDATEWAYIPHFFYKYYVFTYATGLSSGIALAERIEEMGAPARDAYLGMLKAGNSKPPVQLLKEAGVDLTKPDAIEAAAKLLDRSISEIEAIQKRKSQ